MAMLGGLVVSSVFGGLGAYLWRSRRGVTILPSTADGVKPVSEATAPVPSEEIHSDEGTLPEKGSTEEPASTFDLPTVPSQNPLIVTLVLSDDLTVPLEERTSKEVPVPSPEESAKESTTELEFLQPTDPASVPPTELESVSAPVEGASIEGPTELEPVSAPVEGASIERPTELESVSPPVGEASSEEESVEFFSAPVGEAPNDPEPVSTSMEDTSRQPEESALRLIEAALFPPEIPCLDTMFGPVPPPQVKTPEYADPHWYGWYA